MAQEAILRAEVYARALRASGNVKRAEVWVGALCALWVGGAWASSGVERTRTARRLTA
jgi:phenylacetate-coenzyme A ligase PaaK-like adenylate-forming protein